MPSVIKVQNLNKHMKLKYTRKRKASPQEILTATGVKAKAETLAQDALMFMQNYIMAKAKHPTGNLIENLTISIKNTANGFIIGIGNVAKLYKNAPYWYVLNYGKTTGGQDFIPPAWVGSFEGDRPSQEKYGTQRATHGGERRYFIKPQRFTPINYIEATLSYMKNRNKATLKSSKGFTKTELQ